MCICSTLTQKLQLAFFSKKIYLPQNAVPLQHIPSALQAIVVKVDDAEYHVSGFLVSFHATTSLMLVGFMDWDFVVAVERGSSFSLPSPSSLWENFKTVSTLRG